MENLHSFEAIQAGDIQAFQQLFHSYYDKLCRFARFYLKDKAQAEEVVTELFGHLWEKREQLYIQNLHVYLFTSVKNRSLTSVKKSRYQFLPLEDFENSLVAEDAQPIKYLLLAEGEQQVQELLAYLPEKKRLIFTLSRIDGLKYKEIAELLQLSVRTVEDQVFKSVKILRQMISHKKKI